jgi:hypothetical protein
MIRPTSTSLARLRAALALAVAGLCLAATARAAFEDIEVSPRARAMGGAWTALRDDAYAVFHNPAALAWAGRVAAGASNVRPFGYDFSSQNTGAAAFALPGRWGGLGTGIRRFGVDYAGETLLRENTFTFAHGFHLRRDRQSELAVGWAVGWYSLDFGRSVTGLEPGEASTVGLSFGAVAVVRERTRVGFHALHLNNPNIGDRDQEELRRRVSAGVSHAPYPGVETVLEIADELGEAVQYRGGVEFELADFVWARAGIKSDPSVFTAGVGLRWTGFQLDYGFSTGGGVLAETHHLGVGVTLPRRR